MTTKHNYTSLDADIVSAISRGCGTFGAIQDDRGMRDDQGRCRDFRTIDRRLQALRKVGKIKFERPADFTNKQWMLA